MRTQIITFDPITGLPFRAENITSAYDVDLYKKKKKKFGFFKKAFKKLAPIGKQLIKAYIAKQTGGLVPMKMSKKKVKEAVQQQAETLDQEIDSIEQSEEKLIREVAEEKHIREYQPGAPRTSLTNRLQAIEFLEKQKQEKLEKLEAVESYEEEELSEDEDEGEDEDDAEVSFDEDNFISLT